MVATRKSLPNTDDELNPNDPRLKSILKKLKIDGTNVLKGDRQAKQKTAEVVASKNVYHYRGAVYEVTGSELPEWLEAQPARYMSNSNSIEPENAKDSTPSLRGKKRKRETVEPEERLANIPFAQAGGASSGENSDAATPAAGPGSSVPPPAQRRKLNHNDANNTAEGDEGSARHATHRLPPRQSSINGSTARNMPRSTPSRHSHARRLAAEEQEVSNQDSATRTRSARKNSPRRTRASSPLANGTAGVSQYPQRRRQTNNLRATRLGRSQANREPTREDAVAAGFQLSPLPLSDVLPAISKNLMKSICEMAKLNSDMDRKIDEYKMAHLMLKNAQAGQAASSSNPNPTAPDNLTEQGGGAQEPMDTSSDPVVGGAVESPARRATPVAAPATNGHRIPWSSSSPTNTPPREAMPPARMSMDRTTLEDHVKTLPATNKSGNPLRWSFDPSRLNEEGRAESTMFRGRLPEESKSAKRRRIAREFEQVRSWERVQDDVV